MNIFAAGGSSFTQNAFKFLVANKNTLGSADELVVRSTQDAISAQIEGRSGSAELTAYKAKQADTIRKPTKNFSGQHAVKYRDLRVAGAYD